jgi:cobalt-zinc-cadmium efflux system outer membrane protein
MNVMEKNPMKRLLSYTVLVVVALSSTLALAQVQTSGKPSGLPTVKLDALVSELLSKNPELQALRKRYEAALTRPGQESALPDPRITAGWISNGNPLPGAGLGVEPTSNIGFQIAQELPYPGKRTIRGSIARKEADSEAQMYRAKELSLTAQLKTAFYELRFLFETEDILRRNQTLLQQLLRVAEARYSVGKAMQQDLFKSQVEISILENKLVLLEQKKASLVAEIDSLLNRSPSESLGRPEPVESLPELGPLPSLQSQAETASPMLRAQQSVIDSKQLGVQMARKDYYPDFDIMGGYYNQGQMKDMWEFKVQVNVPIYFWRKQRYALEESSLRLVEAQKTYRATDQMLSFRIRDRYLAAEASRKLMDLYSKRILPQAQFALESSLASYETGGVDFLTVLSNLSSILENEINYSEQRAEYLKALAGLEELVARPLDRVFASNGLNKNEVQQ